MSEEIEEEQEEPKKKSKLPLILGLVLALVGGGGGFYATWSGMILAPAAHEETHVVEEEVTDKPDVGFVPVDPLIVTMADRNPPGHLRFRSQLEVPSAYVSDVTDLLPRVIDVLNTYLRALKTEDMENPAALARLRAQMLRRVQIVVGKGRVNDLLIMEFVIN